MNNSNFSAFLTTLASLSVATLMLSGTTSAGLPPGTFSRFISLLGATSESQARAPIEAWIPSVDDQIALLEATEDVLPETKLLLMLKIEQLGLTTTPAFTDDIEFAAENTSEVPEGFARFKSLLGRSLYSDAIEIIKSWLTKNEDQKTLLQKSQVLPETELQLMLNIEKLGVKTTRVFSGHMSVVVKNATGIPDGLAKFKNLLDSLSYGAAIEKIQSWLPYSVDQEILLLKTKTEEKMPVTLVDLMDLIEDFASEPSEDFFEDKDALSLKG